MIKEGSTRDLASFKKEVGTKALRVESAGRFRRLLADDGRFVGLVGSRTELNQPVEVVDTTYTGADGMEHTCPMLVNTVTRSIIATL